MQEMETLQKDLPEVEASLAVETEGFEKERAVVLAEMESFEERRRTLDAERQKIEAGLPRDILGVFYRVSEARQGLAMVRITDAVCSACNVRLRPQVFSEVKRGDALLNCDSCRRFLYYDPDAGQAAPPDVPPQRP